MGDYKDTRKNKSSTEEEESAEAESKEFTIMVRKDRDFSYILITQNMWREIEAGEGIYRIELYNGEEHEYYTYYSGKGKAKISIRELKQGEIYKARISKTDINDILSEINRRTKRKYSNIKLMNKNDEVYLTISTKLLKCHDYKLEKPYGGKARLVIKLKRHGTSYALLQFLLSDYDLEIKYISSIQVDKGKVPRTIERIYKIGDFLAISYRKTKPVTTYIPLTKRIDPSNSLIGKQVIKHINQVHEENGELFQKYELIINEVPSEYIKAVYQSAKQGTIQEYNLIKEKIGLIIAKEFLERLGYGHINEYPLKIFKLKGPDIMATKDGERSVFEVKMTKESMLDIKSKFALEEVEKHVYSKYSREIGSLEIKKYGVIVIGLEDKLSMPLKAFLYFNEWRIDDE